MIIKLLKYDWGQKRFVDDVRVEGEDIRWFQVVAAALRCSNSHAKRLIAQGGCSLHAPRKENVVQA